MSAEIVNLPHDYSDGTVSDNNPEATDLLQQLTTQYAEYISTANAARELANRVLNLPKIAFKDVVQ